MLQFLQAPRIHVGVLRIAMVLRALNQLVCARQVTTLDPQRARKTIVHGVPWLFVEASSEGPGQLMGKPFSNRQLSRCEYSSLLRACSGALACHLIKSPSTSEPLNPKPYLDPRCPSFSTFPGHTPKMVGHSGSRYRPYTQTA